MVKLYSTVQYINISIILSSEMCFLTLKTTYGNIIYLNMSALVHARRVRVPQYNLYCGTCKPGTYQGANIHFCSKQFCKRKCILLYMVKNCTVLCST